MGFANRANIKGGRRSRTTPEGLKVVSNPRTQRANFIGYRVRVNGEIFDVFTLYRADAEEKALARYAAKHPTEAK